MTQSEQVDAGGSQADTQVDETANVDVTQVTDQGSVDTANKSASDVHDEESESEESESEESEGEESEGEESKLSPLEEECDVAADYLEELLDIADLDGDLDTYTEGGRAHVSIVTDAEVLIGKDAVVLEALQELARLSVMTETGRRSRLMLDIGGHRDRRRKELRELAADAVAEVKDSGEAVALSPMNPFERKIVHDAVAEAGCRSESEGDEPKRHVVVLPAA